MKYEKIACVHSNSAAAQQGYELLSKQYSFVEIDEADVIIALGGDGFMLHCYHEYLDSNIPIYGMNKGTVGFLMNEYHDQDLLNRLNSDS